VLILFEPRRTNVPTLLATLPALGDGLPAGHLLQVSGPEPASVPTVEFDSSEVALPLAATEQPHEAVAYVTGIRRVLYRILGWASVGMAVVGAITPGIPTVPFVILAGYFFVRSSPEAHEWLRRSRWFGPILRDWEAHRGVRRSLRNAALALIGASMAITLLIGLPVALAAPIVAMQIVLLVLTLRVRVVEPAPLAPAPILAVPA
jgi:uncharacterized membrane protein YbaN (DUF454 family)